jgi:heme exporter protein C
VAGMLLRSAAPIGASFTLMALISGAIWGKPTWGTWWVWDARLTSTLILFFIYAAIVGIYSSIEDKTKGDRAAALLSLVGVSMIPIIKKSVDWWQTLHQPSTFTLTQAPSMSPEMYLPLLANVLGFYFLFIALLFLRLRTELALREQRKNWFKQKILGD